MRENLFFLIVVSMHSHKWQEVSKLTYLVLGISTTYEKQPSGCSGKGAPLLSMEDALKKDQLPIHSITLW